MRERIETADTRVVKACDLCARALPFARECRHVDPPAKLADQRRIEAGVTRDFFSDAGERQGIAFAAQQIREIRACRIGFHLASAARPSCPASPFAAAACDGSRRHEGQRIVGAFKTSQNRGPGISTPRPSTPILPRPAVFVRVLARESRIALANDEFRADEPFCGRDHFRMVTARALYRLDRIKWRVPHRLRQDAAVAGARRMMKTRSVKSSQVSALSTVTGGADGARCAIKRQPHGPRLPRSSQRRQRRAAIDRESGPGACGIRTIEKEGHRCDIGHGHEASALLKRIAEQPP